MSAYKEIIPDPLALLSAGVRNVLDAAILIHIGRCGTNGTTRPELVRQIPGHPYSSMTSATDRLTDLGLITAVSKLHKTGTPHCFMVTGKGWKLLTTPGDFAVFPQPSIPFKIA